MVGKNPTPANSIVQTANRTMLSARPLPLDTLPFGGYYSNSIYRPSLLPTGTGVSLCGPARRRRVYAYYIGVIL